MNDHDARLDALESRLENLDKNMAGLLDAWNTAGGVVRFVKWAAAVVAACTTLYVSLAVGKDILIHNIQESLK